MRIRPYIPLAVRVQVAERQLAKAGRATIIFENEPQAIQLKGLLTFLFGEGVPLALDHDPPLRARTYNERIKDPASRFTPNANDPGFLIYRTVEDHKRKTNQRGDGAQYPDRVLIKRERKRERKAAGKIKKTVTIRGRTYWRSYREIENEKKRQWPSRPFPQGRGF